MSQRSYLRLTKANSLADDVKMYTVLFGPTWSLLSRSWSLESVNSFTKSTWTRRSLIAKGHAIDKKYYSPMGHVHQSGCIEVGRLRVGRAEAFESSNSVLATAAQMVAYCSHVFDCATLLDFAKI